VHAGYQHQFGAVVVGVEGSYQLGTGNWAIENGYGINPAIDSYARMSHLFTVGPRLGIAAGHWMPYVTGGYANAGYDFGARGPVTTSTATTLIEQAHTRLNGWYIGVGGEWKISPGWTAGIEYRHYDFGDRTTTAFHPGAGASATFPLGIPTGTPLENVRFDATTETVTARVTWRWGREVSAPLK
jgi:opacity protein-like surface antigen